MGTQLSDDAAPENAVKKLINIESSERSERIREIVQCGHAPERENNE